MLGPNDLEALLERRPGPCVSIYMPMHRGAGQEVLQDPIRLKNCLRTARLRLEQAGVPVAKRRGLLAPAEGLLEDEEFWKRPADGLAVLLAPGFHAVHRLPASFEERVLVGDRFHVKPLLPLLSGDGRFYVLALSQRRVRLLSATRDGVTALEPEGLPESLSDALWEDAALPPQQAAVTGRGSGSAFHGQGGPDDLKLNLVRYFHRVDDAVLKALHGDEAPLVLACVDSYVPLYRKATRYPHVLERHVPGNPDVMSDEDLRARAWPVVEPWLRRGQEERLARYRELAGTGQTSGSLEEIVAAARDGRVESLFVAADAYRWGALDGERDVVVHEEPAPGDLDLLDLAASRTLRTGGKVFVVDPEGMPDPAVPAAALLRY